MLYELIKKTKGRETVVMVDVKQKIEAQQRKYKTSQKGRLHGNRVEYLIRESKENDTYKRQSRSNWNSYPG